ncbi:hypothetical protein [Kitasatospora sp. MAP5-34]|uniref:hypothetical protein n=1 Tax=Kitasatospora sp. MAP5-34 TaxID=3035102 RepID=UPI00247622A7|nr:hypothetical protein [Kitasatospora sp. MAP5-34]MDH6580446.1 hypothetical protein [Kitasatospora sp. MAP5-34]
MGCLAASVRGRRGVHADHRDAHRTPPNCFGVEPGAGHVYYVLLDGDAWFANTSIELWLKTLHHYGQHVSRSEAFNDPTNEKTKPWPEFLDQLAVVSKPKPTADMPPRTGAVASGFLPQERVPANPPVLGRADAPLLVGGGFGS